MLGALPLLDIDLLLTLAKGRQPASVAIVIVNMSMFHMNFRGVRTVLAE
jgi:hypothetical protein